MRAMSAVRELRTPSAATGYALRETLHRGSGNEPRGIVIPHTVSRLGVRRLVARDVAAVLMVPIVGSARYIRQYKIAITFDTI